MSVQRKPASWSSSDAAIKAVQVAFDVEEAVLEAVRTAAFQQHRSPSDQIRHLLELPVSTRPKRPRLTVSLNANDYELLAQRYQVQPEDRLLIKEKVTTDLINFAHTMGSQK